MPHSSGGGSHSGGSSGGSSHSSSGGSHSGGARTSYPVYDTYHKGTHRYVYYRRGRPHYYYSQAKASSSSLGFLIFFLLVWMVFSIPFWVVAIRIPSQVKTDYDTRIIIQDNASLFTAEDQERLYQQFKEFQNITGVTPAVVTTTNDQWEDYYNSISQYAYDVYINMFDDEKHWLVIYSTDNNEIFEDWYWEGMIGDDTGSAIGSDSESILTESIQKYLTARSRYTIAQAIAEGFSDVAQVTMKPHIQWTMVLFLLIFDILPMVTAGPELVNCFKHFGMDNAVRCPTDTGALKEDTCEYCGGVYIHGLHVSCPHCGAPVKATAPKQ